MSWQQVRTTWSIFLEGRGGLDLADGKYVYIRVYMYMYMYMHMYTHTLK